LSRAPLVNRGIDWLEGSPYGHWLMMLIFEGEGAETDAARAGELARREGGEALGERPARAWYEHRYAVSFNQSPVFRAGAFNDTLEVAAPWSRIDELFHAVRKALARHVIVLAHLSHAYPDGCSIYFTFGGAARSGTSALGAYDSAWREALVAARDAGGAISHHHGIGRSKAEALEADLGPAAAVLRRVLRAWDPDRIMNPGALLPASPGTSSSLPAGPLTPALDTRSELVTVGADERLGELEARLSARGFTLGGSPPLELSVGEWLARGLPGAPDAWLDPTDHVLAGLQARLHTGERLLLQPVPRRATGPDLSALILGAGGRLGRTEFATLRIHRNDAPPPRALAFAQERSPPLGSDEREAFDDLAAAVLHED
ncbi:MAG TPA: FAD-linked oxidase C-terminal domain-containing protein, partial [Polyangiaceae bacterium]|nr:FAD-linked oxidase C-terminal domain-containing protein [Polyangiaceae bacterium]